MTSHLCYEGTFQQCIIDISPELARRHQLTIELRVLVVIRLHGAPCPGSLDPSAGRTGQVQVLVNYLVDKTSSELRPGRPQTVRPVITEKHSNPCISSHQES